MDVDTGLSIDMLDVDRLREWARLLLVHGADIGHWGSVPHVAGKMQTIATGVEKAVRDIGSLREELDQVRQQLAEAREQNAKEQARTFTAQAELRGSRELRMEWQGRAEAAEAKLAEAEHEAEEQKARADHHVRIAQKRGEKHDALRSALSAKELEWREPTGAYANLRSETAYNKAREGCADDLAALLSPPSGTETKP